MAKFVGKALMTATRDGHYCTCLGHLGQRDSDRIVYILCRWTQGGQVIGLYNSPAYWADSKVTKKIWSCEYDSRSHIHKNLFSLSLTIRPSKLECFVLGVPFKLRIMKKSSLLGRFVSYKENLVLWIWLQDPYSQHFFFFLTYYKALWVRVFVPGRPFKLRVM